MANRASQPPATQGLLAKLTADKKKFSLMLGLCGVAMLLWGRLLLKEVPRTAVADPESVAASAEPGNATHDPAPRVAETMPAITVVLPDETTRDLFRFDSESYRRLATSESDGAPPGRLSPARTADPQSRLTRVRELATALELGSVVQGPEPRAVINGLVVGPGDTVEGFVVRRIAERYVELELQGVIVRLHL